MAVHFRKLKNDQENRSVRAVIMNGSEHINVYEPSLKDVRAIIDAQEGWVSVEDGVNISDEDVLKKLIPMLTDIEGMEDMTDEEILDVANNPSVSFLSVQSEIQSIIIEIYRHIVVLSRRQLQDADFELETMLTQKESFDRTIAMATKYGKDKDLPAKLQKALDDMTEAYKNLDDSDTKEVLEKYMESNVGGSIFPTKEDESKTKPQPNNLSNANSVSEDLLKAIQKNVPESTKIMKGEQDLSGVTKTTTVKKDGNAIYTSDGSQNLTEMIEQSKKRFADKSKNRDVNLD
jgi:hypothetical protein